jgi:dephospho-CoA kinase
MNMIAAQMPAELKRARADFCIDNVGSLDELERNVDALWSSLQRNAVDKVSDVRAMWNELRVMSGDVRPMESQASVS